MQMVFTLIEYTEGGNISPCSCCTECQDGQISITSWDNTKYEEIVAYVSRIEYLRKVKNYSYDYYTLLINGLDTKGFDVTSHIEFAPWVDEEPSEEEKTYNTYVEKFWAEVKARSDQAAAEYVEEERLKAEQEKKRKEQAQLLAKQAEETRQRVEYETLKKKFENS